MRLAIRRGALRIRAICQMPNLDLSRSARQGQFGTSLVSLWTEEVARAGRGGAGFFAFIELSQVKCSACMFPALGGQ
jgi:hypothetical protein